ncbi:MAG TPA: hypothetical protein EYP56_09560 [Planctomycetaceae bacterium]|nr:hypothetical protein [Planctomycetaceae bacterium]HIQ22233.1 hypothetical protein [Planctomycetota bacterium]
MSGSDESGRPAALTFDGIEQAAGPFVHGGCSNDRRDAMLCPNCGAEVPDAAVRCVACEAEVDFGLTPEELESARAAFELFPEEVKREMARLAEGAETADEFLRRMFVGNCPICDSSDTRSCEDDPEVYNACVGHCLECGQYWCTDCGEFFEEGDWDEHDCPFWDDFDSGMDDEDEFDEDEFDGELFEP